MRLINFFLVRLNYELRLDKKVFKEEKTSESVNFVERHNKFFQHNPEIDILRYADKDHFFTKQFKDKLSAGIYSLEKNSCPICGKDNYISVARSCEGFGWDVCTNCGLLQMSTRLTNDDMNTFYVSGEYNSVCMGNISEERLFELESRAMSLYFIDIIQRLDLDLKSLSIVEIGCGSGGILFALKEAGARSVVGFDIDRSRIAFGKKYINELYAQDALSEDIDDYNEFDVIILSNILEHLSTPKDFLLRLSSKISSDNPVVLIDVPNLDTSFKYSSGTFNDFLKISHVWYFNFINIERLLNQTGFDVEYMFPRGASFTVVARKSLLKLQTN